MRKSLNDSSFFDFRNKKSFAFLKIKTICIFSEITPENKNSLHFWELKTKNNLHFPEKKIVCIFPEKNDLHFSVEKNDLQISGSRSVGFSVGKVFDFSCSDLEFFRIITRKFDSEIWIFRFKFYFKNSDGRWNNCRLWHFLNRFCRNLAKLGEISSALEILQKLAQSLRKACVNSHVWSFRGHTPTSGRSADGHPVGRSPRSRTNEVRQGTPPCHQSPRSQIFPVVTHVWSSRGYTPMSGIVYRTWSWRSLGADADKMRQVEYRLH